MPVKGDVCALKLHARVGPIVPAVVQDDAGTLAENVEVGRREPQLQNSHDDFRGHWSTHRAFRHIVELLTFHVTKASAC
jgi:hypothetical protein